MRHEYEDEDSEARDVVSIEMDYDDGCDYGLIENADAIDVYSL